MSKYNAYLSEPREKEEPCIHNSLTRLTTSLYMCEDCREILRLTMEVIDAKKRKA